MLACTVGPAGLGEPFALQGEGVVAVVTPVSGCGDSDVRVGLWGDGYGTQGEVAADVVPDDDGSTWLHFSVHTGLGEAIAALRIEGEAGLLPLGTRPGEHGVALRRVAIDRDALERASAENEVQLRALVNQWRNGAFLIQEDGAVVGELRFRGDMAPMVSLFDAWWLTPRPVEAAVSTQGAEILLAFDVEPSLHGEGGLLRVNVPLAKVVAPIGDVPVSEERRFSLVPGMLAEGQFEALSAAASQAADEMEVVALEFNARQMAALAKQADGSCSSWADMAPDWGVMFAGYTVQISREHARCVVGVEATRPQHGRRYRGEVRPLNAP